MNKRHYFIVLFLVLGISNSSNAQDSSLKDVRKWDLDSLYQIAFSLSGTTGGQSTIEARRYLKASKQIGDSFYIAYAYDLLGMEAFARNLLDSAFVYSDSAISVFRAIKDSNGLSTALHNKSLFHEYLGEYATALQLIHSGREMDLINGYKSENDIFYYHRLSGIVYEQNQTELALRYAHKAWSALHETDFQHSYMIPEMHINYAYLYLDLEVYDLATYHANKAYSFTKIDSLEILRSSALEVLSYTSLHEGDTVKANNLAQESFKLSLAQSDAYYRIYGYISLLDFSLELRNLNLAKECADVVSKHDKDFNENPTFAWAVNSSLYSYYSLIKNPARALMYLEGRNEAEERINKFDGLAAMRHFDEEIAARGKQLALAKNQLQSQKIREQRIYIFGAIALLCILSLALVYIAISRKKVQERNLILRERNELIEEQKTEILQQQKSLKEQNEELNKLLTSKDRLFSILAHDLRQPFNQILGIIDLIEVDALNAEERKEIMIGLKSSVQSTSDLVSNVLVWSKAQFAGVSINKIDLPLSETVKKALLYFSIALNKKGINVNFDVPENLKISFDKDHFDSVLRNIFSNAYKFSTEGSSISIEATANYKQKRVYLNIIDQGIGMDKQQVEKLKDGSSAGDSYLGTLNEDGTGIGMIIVRDFLAENEASFTIKSSIGEGTSFILDLPMA